MSSAVHLAVIAHIRHAETTYNELLAGGWEQQDARAEIDEQVRSVLAAWETQEE